MRYRKRKKAAAQVMVMTVAVVAVLAALMVLACSQVFRGAQRCWSSATANSPRRT